jgi:hypothetical protein
MSRRLDWDKAKSDKLKGMPSEPADVDMRHEPEHQAWWYGKTRKERATSKEALKAQMAEAFGRGRPAAAVRPKEVVAALISPKIKALLAELERRRKEKNRVISQGPRRPKARTKSAKPRG